MVKNRFKLRNIVCAAIIILMPAGVFARGVSAYLPLNMSPEIERQIERVLILADKPVMTRPIAVATVLDSLQAARKKDGVLCREVEQYLRRYMKGAGLTRLRAEVAIDAGESEQVLPNQYGEKADSSWEVSGEAFYRSGDYLSLNLGGVAYQGHSSPSGTMLSLGTDYAQLDIGYRAHWLSPFTDSSMLLSTEAPTMPSVTLSNYKPISGLGLSYQVFLAEMSKSSRIVFQNRFTTGNPRLAGLHLQTEPVRGFALSVNRQLQFGGGERGQNGFNDIINALFNPVKYDNPRRSSVNSVQEFGNQQASVTSRMVFPGKHPFAVYFEYAGEDTSRFSNYLLGNTSFSVGIDIPRLWNRFDLTCEATEWQNAWYVHHIYRDGLTNRGLVVGHWFGDQRQFNDGVGGMTNMVRLGWQSLDGGYMQGIYRTLKNESYSVFSYQRMHELGLSYSHPWRGKIVGAELYSGRDVFGDWYARLGASIDFAQDSWNDSADSIATTANSNDLTDMLLDMGMTYSRSETDRGSIQGKSSLSIASGSNAHLGLGARRSVSEHSDLGARIEWDRIAGHDLISVRMIDYRYRIGKSLALGSFFGAGRYDFGTPAYGWYFGMGPQLLNVLPGWDLCIDARLHLKMVRDKILSSDPPGRLNPDVFEIRSVAVYLSRKF